MAITDFYEPLVFIEKRSMSDGMGGFLEDYTEGAEFMGGISTDNSTQGRIAEQQGVKSIYTITIPLNVPLKFADVVKRKSDNRYFKISGDPSDMETPKVANMEFKQVQAEKWVMPKE